MQLLIAVCCFSKILKRFTDYKNVGGVAIFVMQANKRVMSASGIFKSIKSTVFLINTEIILFNLSGRNRKIGVHISSVFISLECQTSVCPEGDLS